MEFLVGFQSDQLRFLIHFVNKSGCVESKKKSVHFFMCRVISRVAAIKNLLTILSCTTVKTYALPTFKH